MILSVDDREDFKVMRKKIFFALNNGAIDNNDRAHSGKHCYGKTPMKTWNDSKQLAKSKNLGNMFKKSDTISNEDNHS